MWFVYRPLFPHLPQGSCTHAISTAPPPDLLRRALLDRRPSRLSSSADPLTVPSMGSRARPTTITATVSKQDSFQSSPQHTNKNTHFGSIFLFCSRLLFTLLRSGFLDSCRSLVVHVAPSSISFEVCLGYFITLAHVPITLEYRWTWSKANRERIFASHHLNPLRLFCPTSRWPTASTAAQSGRWLVAHGTRLE